ncbi:MAG: coiled coil domain-containing protein [Thermoanaerobaculia bacterium]|nr:coiled coil domain-containing protein [Thermoanaerobaculia bacterium]
MNREIYLEKLKARLDEMNAELDKLEARSRRLKADARIRYEKKMTDLRDRRDELSEQITKIKEAGADSWEALKTGAESALSELVAGLSEAKERLEPVAAGR